MIPILGWRRVLRQAFQNRSMQGNQQPDDSGESSSQSVLKSGSKLPQQIQNQYSYLLGAPRPADRHSRT